MPEPDDIIRPADAAAIALARQLLAAALHGALGVIHPDLGGPQVSRVAVGLCADGLPILLVSSLSLHTRAMRANPAVSLLVGEPGPKGDPLTHPRLSVQARAAFVERNGPEHPDLRRAWLLRHPKSGLYIDFADFGFVRLIPTRADLNGGFGKAYGLSADQIMLP